MKKSLIHHEDVPILNLYASNSMASITANCKITKSKPTIMEKIKIILKNKAKKRITAKKKKRNEKILNYSGVF